MVGVGWVRCQITVSERFLRSHHNLFLWRTLSAPNSKLPRGMESRVERIDAVWLGKFPSQYQLSAGSCGLKSDDSRENGTTSPLISVTA